MNIAPRASYNPAFRDLFDQWEWVDWIKWQVDLAASAGANTVRLIGDVQGVLDSTFTLATYLSRWTQLIEYCDSIGLCVYVCGGGRSQFGSSTVEDITDVLAALGTHIEQFGNVVAFDIVQEAYPNWSELYGVDIVASVRQAGYTGKVTFSKSIPSVDHFPADYYRRALGDVVDFWDIHVYGVGTTLGFNAWYWGREEKPVLIGEYGVAQDASTTDRDDYLASIIDTVNTPTSNGRRPAGALAWAITSQSDDAENDWGVWTTDGTPRAEMLAAFQALT